MRRLLALATLIALIGVGCSSDDTTPTTAADTTTTEDVTTTAEVTTTTAMGSVYIALGASALESTDKVELALPFGNEIAVEVLTLPTGSVNPDVDWQESVGTFLREDRWTVTSPQEEGGCAFATGQIVVSTDAVAAFADNPNLIPAGSSFSAEDEPTFGTLAGQTITLAKVPPGEELRYIRIIINGQLGIASFHYPIAPLPRWKYGPAVPAVPGVPINTVPGADELSTSGERVLVLDRFGPSRLDLGQLLETGMLEEDANSLVETDTFITGHGEFIVGILARMGVAADEEDVVLSDDTVADEKSIADKLSASAAKVTNMSMGVSPCLEELEDGGESISLPPIGLAAAMVSRVTADDPPVVVAAAGNHGVAGGCEPSWYPARFAEGLPAWASYRNYLIAVQAVNTASLDDDIAVLASNTESVGSASLKDGSLSSPFRATYSACDSLNGVTVWAPGTNVISDYMGELGVWSGTSFAAPQISGAIALGLTVK